MQNGKTTMNTIFDGDKVFTVPNYQRAYAWQEKNLNDFYDDIDNQAPNKKYFFGTFLFHKKGRDGDYDLIDIVDGQQRLTTFTIFMSELLQGLGSKKSTLVSSRVYRRFIADDGLYKVQLANEDNSLFHAFVLGGKVAPAQSPETPSQKYLIAAKSFFAKKLASAELEDLERYYKVATEAEALLYVVDDISSAVQIFELINDRGKRLSDLESIKSFLMYMLGLDTEMSNQPIIKVQEDFASIYRTIESESLDASDVLRYHTIAFEKSLSTDYDKPKEYIRSKILSMRKSGKTVTNEILCYTARLKESYRIFAEIKNNKTKSLNFEKLLMIGRVAPFYPIIMKIYAEHPAKLEDLLEALVAFTFRASLFGLRSNGESDLYAAIRENKDLVAVVKTIIASGWWDINKRVMEAIESRNYYDRLSRNMVRFILFDYENSLRGAKGFPTLSMQDYFNEDTRSGLSIEHITAKKAKDLKTTEVFKENYLNALGNLVIDSKAPNSRKGNQNTKVKKVEYAGAPLMSQNEINISKTKWDNLKSVKEFIDKRDAELKSFVKKRWSLA